MFKLEGFANFKVNICNRIADCASSSCPPALEWRGVT